MNQFQKAAGLWPLSGIAVNRKRSLSLSTSTVGGLTLGLQCIVRCCFRGAAVCLFLCVLVACSISPVDRVVGDFRGNASTWTRCCCVFFSFAGAVPGKGELPFTGTQEHHISRQRHNSGDSLKGHFTSRTETRTRPGGKTSTIGFSTAKQPSRAGLTDPASTQSAIPEIAHASTGASELPSSKTSPSCPITPSTTPVPPNFVYFCLASYGVLVALTLLWWLVRSARWKHAARRQAQLVDELIIDQEERESKAPRLGVDLDAGPDSRNRAEPEAHFADADEGKSVKEKRLRYSESLYTSPLIFVRGMLLQQEGCNRSLLGSLVQNVLVISIALATVLPFIAITAAVVRGPRVGLTALFIPSVFFEAQIPGPPPTTLEPVPVLQNSSGGASSKPAGPGVEESLQHDFSKSVPASHATYWAANTECMQIRERVCVSLILFCFCYLALAQGLWKQFLRDISLVPAPLSACTFLRVRYAYLSHHLIEKLARQGRLGQLQYGQQLKTRGANVRTPASELRWARFTAMAAATADTMAGGKSPQNSADLAVSASQKQGGPPSSDATERACSQPPLGELAGMFMTEQEASQWGVGHQVLAALMTRTVVEVRQSIGLQTHRYVDVESMRLRYSDCDSVFILTAAVQENGAITDAQRLAKAIAGASDETAVDNAVGAFHRVLLRPSDIADRLSVEQNRLRVPSTPFWGFVITSLLHNSVYLAILAACWYHCFTHNFMLLVVLLVFAVSELLTRTRLMVSQQSNLLGFAASREKAVVEQPATLLRLLDRKDSGVAGGSRLVSAWVKAPATSIVPGDIVRLTRGGTVPCDMLLVNGTVAVDESSLRGDVAPLRKRPLRAFVPRKLDGNLDEQVSYRVWGGHIADSLVYAGTRVISCTEARGRSRILDMEGLSAAVEAEEARTKAYKSEKPGGSGVCTNFESELDAAAGVQSQVVAALMDAGASNEGGVCWGVAVRTGMQTAAGQQLRRLRFPEPEMFQFGRQLPWVCLILLIFWIVLLSIHAAHTRSLLLSFRYSVESLLSLLPLWLPGLCGLFAALAARRLRLCGGAETDRFVAVTLQRQAFQDEVVAAFYAPRTSQPGPQGRTSALTPLKTHGNQLSDEMRSKTLEISSSIPVVRPFFVACAAPGKLPAAASVRVVCFDKTGTLTREDFSFVGCQPVEGDEVKALVPYDPAGPSPAALAGLRPSQQVAHPSHGDVRGTSTLRGLLPSRLLECLACCHGLSVVEDRVLGTPLEQQMFQSTGWCVEWSADGGQGAEAAGATRRLLFLPPKPTSASLPHQGGGSDDLQGGFVLLQRLLFDPVRQLMSVVVARRSASGTANEAEVLVFCKGSYEAVAALCRPETVPPGFLERAGMYAREGVYVLAAACKTMGVRGGLSTWPNLERAAIESELVMQGLLLFRNELRADAAYAVQQLRAAGIRSVIVTGDSPMTAISVARRTGMVGASLEDTLLNGGRRLEKPGNEDSVGGTHRVILGDVVNEDGGGSPNTISGALKNIGAVGRGDVSALWNRVKWIDVDSGEEVESWRILFTEEYRELALTARAVEILAEAPDTTLMHHTLPQHDYEDVEDDEESDEEERLLWCRSRNGSQDSQSTDEIPLVQNSAWRLSGGPKGKKGSRPSSAVSLIKAKPPTLIDRILLRVRIFARLSPQTKALVVELFQRQDLVVAMVGDGTNDCFAIKQAQVGVAFGRGGLCHSVAPFAVVTDQHGASQNVPALTSDPTTDSSADTGKGEATAQFDSCGVVGILTLVREGRATVVTSFAVYKLQILYGILSSIAYLMLAIGAYGTPNPFASFFSSVAMLLGLSLAMLWSIPSLAPLARRAPSTNPLGTRAIGGVAAMVLVDVLALVLLFALLYGPARRPLPCAWLQREVREELLHRQHVEQLLKLHDIPADTIARRLELTRAHRKPNIRSDELLSKPPQQGLHGRDRGAAESVQERPEAKIHTEEPPRSGGVARPTGAANTSHGSRGRKPERSPGGASFLESRTGAPRRPPDSRREVLRRVWPRELQRSHSAEALVASGHNSELSVKRVARILKGPSSTELPQEWTAQSWAEVSMQEHTPTPSPDSLVGQGLRPGMRTKEETCGRDGRTEASVIFLWLGACLLNAALIFSRGGAFRKSLWANPLLLPLSFLFGSFLVFLVAVPESELSCVFMVNCPAKEVRKQQQAQNVIGIVKRIVTDAEEKNMYSHLAKQAEREVVEARELLGLQPDVALGKPHESQTGGGPPPARTDGDRAPVSRPTGTGSHFREEAPAKRSSEERHLAETKELLTMDLEWQRKNDNLATRGGGSELSTWFGQMLLYVLCLMSILNGLIHVYIIGEKNGSPGLLERCRRAFALQRKTETVPV
ncbi:haloacid dehalogenase family hydrolase domain-containing protein [Cystoisospora suis]|uniref:Haloacid dehalogenase family hydrolase domain-containing protein n=1 Tax=Cystoisospora suis TaxID=483139 RepID=A0A2C6KYH1_9APIC|nr:haloacid dehalogenase family hydrolase domain-containing protein [Cystoisospora suis]